jgi:hypothetical protein
MSRPRSPHVIDVKARLIARLKTNFLRPGDRFLSARAVADRFAVSYQTAHRLLRELQDEGHLTRAAASGTFVPGRSTAPSGVSLLFHPRARRPGSFGHQLATQLATLLAREGLRFALTYTDAASADGTGGSGGAFPVIWEVPAAVAGVARAGGRALLLNDRPAPGFPSVHIDSLSVDDYSGGVCAAQLLVRRMHLPPAEHETVILAGPKGDARSNQRAAGFLSHLPAQVVTCPTWYLEDALAVAPRVLAKRPRAVFCCNDRLAQGLVQAARAAGAAAPAVVGFDDAPVAETLNLTTIAIPWAPLLVAAVGLVKRRLAGDAGDAVHQIFPPRPVVRGL